MGCVLRIRCLLLLILIAGQAWGDTEIWLPESDRPFSDRRIYPGPAWSPDGSQLAFFVNTPPLMTYYYCSSLKIVTLDTGSTHACGPRACYYRFGRVAWSPTGSEIAFNDDYLPLWLLDPGGCTYGRLITSSGYDPAWSRNGAQIAFVTGAPGPATVVKTVAVTGGPEQLIVSDASSPTWSPDGESIAFVRGGNLWTVAIDGTDERHLTSTPNVEWPSWSPDGRQIAYSCCGNERSGESIWIIPAEGGDPQPLTALSSTRWDSGPSWSPDGTQLAYFTVRSGPPERFGIVIAKVGPTAIESRGWGKIKNLYRRTSR